MRNEYYTKLYKTIHPINVLNLILFLYGVYFGVVSSHKIFFSCISMSSLTCVQRFCSKMRLVKTFLCTQLKQTNLENQLHVSTKGPKEGFNGTAFNISCMNSNTANYICEQTFN